MIAGLWLVAGSALLVAIGRTSGRGGRRRARAHRGEPHQPAELQPSCRRPRRIRPGPVDRGAAAPARRLSDRRRAASRGPGRPATPTALPCTGWKGSRATTSRSRGAGRTSRGGFCGSPRCGRRVPEAVVPPIRPVLSALRMLNTRFYIAPPGEPRPAPGFRVVHAGPDATVLRDDAALPRAYVVPAAARTPYGQALDLLARGAVDPRRQALVPPGAPVPSRPGALRGWSRSAQADRLAPDHLRIHVGPGPPGWLVVAVAARGRRARRRLAAPPARRRYGAERRGGELGLPVEAQGGAGRRTSGWTGRASGSARPSAWQPAGLSPGSWRSGSTGAEARAAPERTTVALPSKGCRRSSDTARWRTTAIPRHDPSPRPDAAGSPRRPS